MRARQLSHVTAMFCFLLPGFDFLRLTIAGLYYLFSAAMPTVLSFLNIFLFLFSMNFLYSIENYFSIYELEKFPSLFGSDAPPFGRSNIWIALPSADTVFFIRHVDKIFKLQGISVSVH